MSRYPRKPPQEQLPLEQAPDFLTAGHVSLVLGLSKGMVYELLREGKIPSFKLGSRVFVRKADMARLGEAVGAKEGSDGMGVGARPTPGR